MRKAYCLITGTGIVVSSPDSLVKDTQIGNCICGQTEAANSPQVWWCWDAHREGPAGAPDTSTFLPRQRFKLQNLKIHLMQELTHVILGP